ncbi:MAG: hypothetical protein KR126chlam6_00826 [Candidatus Anoxychlamydiales bacterium]|nr:hypothetical protein [Candidatus Anoxychlamydiales bacterium]
MKKFYCILFIFLSISAILFAEETFKEDVIPEINQKPLAELDMKEIQNLKDSYFYVKLGSTILVQNIGLGYRSRNLKSCRGNDLTFNLHAPLLGLGKDNKSFMPSFKYSYLKYKDSVIHSSYFGVGFEMGIWMQTHGRIVKGYIPNIELVWGKEREAFHFSQFGINVVPAAGAVILASAGIIEGGQSAGWGALFAAAATSVSFSYTIGF